VTNKQKLQTQLQSITVWPTVSQRKAFHVHKLSRIIILANPTFKKVLELEHES